MLRIAFFSFAFVIAFLARATDYYIAPSGNDANNGTSASTAWRTIDRVNQSTYVFQPGDRLLFQRGGVYRGKVDLAVYGSASTPFTMTAYGTGADPVISGSKVVSGWTVYGGNKWKSYVGAGLDVKYLFANGQLMTLARYPNTGWLRNDQGTSTSLQDAALNQPNGYWIGATLVVRASNWNYDLATIAGFSGSTLTFPTIYDQLWNYDWGYFLCNKLSELDQPSEWYYDKVTGYLYFQAPGNANPSTMTVEAATEPRGAQVFWHRNHVIISGIAFQHQTEAGVFVEDADNTLVDDCSFTDLYRGIVSVGNSNTYSNSTFTRTYGTALHMVDEGTVVSGNTLTDIAMVPGLGETSWGYMGIRCLGSSFEVRNNTLTNIGYTGISAGGSSLVEKNVIVNAAAILNDGGGISFDDTDGLIIQDNIVRDCIGSLESSATNDEYYRKLCFGIYFGDDDIRNTTVQRNTVSNCRGAGIHVDHTMGSSGNAVKNNTFFDNDVQMSISDYSNNHGASAVAPFHVAQYNEVYSGNVMYSVTKDQLCLELLNCYGAAPVDFGTFTNNRYFNPYNELSISERNTLTGSKNFTLERWQLERSEDVGSTRSPLRSAAYSTVQELGSNIVQNGQFATDIAGWTGWPTNAVLSRVTDKLDAGALKAYLPDNSMYGSFTLDSPNPASVQNNAWYRLRFSIQSNAVGDLVVGMKGASQGSTPYRIWEQQIPFSIERRDLECYFQSNLTDQANMEFTNKYTDPMYYLDNVEVKKVSVLALDPLVSHKLYVNEGTTSQSYPLPEGCWKDPEGNMLPASITLAPYASKVAYRVEGPDCDPTPPPPPPPPPSPGSIRLKCFLGGALDEGQTLMRADLVPLGSLPNAEPYTALGFLLENTGVTIAPAVLQGSGELAVVDWVVVELRQWNANYTVAGRRAAILLRNGTVVSPSGDVQLTFNASAVDRFVSVRHRNHLGVMYATKLVGDGQLVDLTLQSSSTYGTEAQKSVSGKMAMWPGNVSEDSHVKYTGAANDRDVILLNTGGSLPTNTVTGYWDGDVNLDGKVSYTGAHNDRDAVLTTIGGVMTSATRMEQLP